MRSHSAAPSSGRSSRPASSRTAASVERRAKRSDRIPSPLPCALARRRRRLLCVGLRPRVARPRVVVVAARRRRCRSSSAVCPDATAPAGAAAAGAGLAAGADTGAQVSTSHSLALGDHELRGREHRVAVALDEQRRAVLQVTLEVRRAERAGVLAETHHPRGQHPGVRVRGGEHDVAVVAVRGDRAVAPERALHLPGDAGGDHDLRFADRLAELPVRAVGVVARVKARRPGP